MMLSELVSSSTHNIITREFMDSFFYYICILGLGLIPNGSSQVFTTPVDAS